MFWDRYEYLCKKKGKSPNALAKEMGAGTSACTYWKNGTVPKGETLMKIAEAFDCSVDYLLERTDNSQSHKSPAPAVALGDISNNNGVIGGIANNAPVMIKNGETEPPNGQEVALLKTFRRLDEFTKAKALIYVEELYNKAER